MKRMTAANCSLDLDGDYIGGQGSLTNAEEKVLNEFFRQRKRTSKKAGVTKTKSIKQSNMPT